MAAAQHNYTPCQLAFMRRQCRSFNDRELATLFNLQFGTQLTVDQIKGTRHRYKLLTGRDGRFKKGNIPSPMAGAKTPNSTSFKKGHRPVNHRPVGSARISRDGIPEIKVAEPNKWRSKHAVIWEQHHGQPVPRGCIVRFIDGDRTNVKPDNLTLITRGENAVLNKRHPNATGQQLITALNIIRLDNTIKERENKP